MGVNGIYGLSGSGIDVESMVKVGMLSKQKQYDKMQQTYTKNEWTKQAYNEIYNKITTFSTSTLSNYKMSSSMNAKSAESSNADAVTATANGNAVIMKHKVDVNSLSSSAYLVATESAAVVNQGADSDDSVQLQDYIFQRSTYKMTDNTLTIYDKDGTLISDSEEGVTVGVNETAFEFTVSDGQTEATLKYTYGDLIGLKQSGSKIKDTDNPKTFSDFVSDFNALGTNIRASYDAVNNKFSFYNKEGGEANGIQFTMTTGQAATNTANFFQGMKLAQSVDGELIGSDGKAFDADTNYIGVLPETSASVTSTAEVTYTVEDEDGEESTVKAGLDTTLKTLSDTYDFGSNFNLSINGTSIAKTVSVSSTEALVDPEDDEKFAGQNTTLYSLLTDTLDLDELDDEDSLTFSIKGVEITLPTEMYYEDDDEDQENPLYRLDDTVTIKDLVDAINLKSDETNVEASYDSTTGKFTLSTLNPSDDSDENTIELEADGKMAQILEGLSLSGTDALEYNDITVGELVGFINAASSDTNVEAAFDTATGKFTLSSTLQGDASEILLTSEDADTISFFTNVLNLSTDTDEDDDTFVSVTGSTATNADNLSFGVKGTNGSVTIDGVEYNELTDNSVTAFGVTYKFHSVTSDAVNVNIEQDTDAIIDKVKSFVEDYNTLLGSLYDKYNEKKYSDYAPLTTSQKETMKDEQIEKWEEKAKSGLLYHDQTLSKIVTKMRNAISTPIDGLTGNYTSAYSIGISTTGIYGQLTLDEDKLRAALTNDSDSVYNVISTLSEDDDFNSNGLAQRLGDVMVEASSLIKDRAGTDDSTNDDSDLGSLMRELQNKMSDFKKLLDAFEDRLYKKYDAMEVALATLGTQLSYITGNQ